MLDLTTANNLEVSGNSDDSYSFFDAFRQSLEEKLNERFTVEELRQQCKSHIESKPVDPLCSSELSTNASSDINDKIEEENPDLDETIIGSNEEWGGMEVEGRILCKIHAVTLHVVEKKIVEEDEKWTYHIIKQATGNNIDQDKRAIHIVKLGESHFLPIFCDRKRSGVDHCDNDGDMRNDNSKGGLGVSLTFQASESINPEMPPELDQKSKRFWRINVPKNSDCLFLSFILAYLIPILYDDHVFEKRFSSICGLNPENTYAKCEFIKNLLKSFNPFLSMSSTYDDKTFLWLVKLFRERVSEHLKKIPDSLRARNFDSSCSDHEIKAIEMLMGCNIHATHSGESGDSHGACDASIIELVYDTRPSGEKYYNFYVPKEFGEKFAVYCRLNQFVKSFVVQFTVKLRNYRNQLLPGGKTKVDDPGMMVGAAGQVIGGVLSFTAGMGFTGAPAGKELANNSINFYYENKERNLAKKIIKNFERFLVDYARFKEMLVKVGGEIFRNFECQFCKFTDHSGTQRAMDKLAEDAIIRMLKYINNQEFQDDKTNPFELITKGVILGKSKSNKLKNGRTVIDDSGKEHRTTDIFENTGLFISDGGMENYFSPKKVGGASKYGYRLPFDWENNEEWLNFHYSKLSIRVQRYQYLISSSDEYNRKLKDVLHDFNYERVPVKTEDVLNVHESIKEGRNIILDGLETISTKQDEHFNLSTERLKCMQGELQSIAADIGKMKNTTHGELEKIQDSCDALISITANLSNTISEGKISSNEWLSMRVEEIYADLKMAVKQSAESHPTNAEANPVKDERVEKACLQAMPSFETSDAGMGKLMKMIDRKISEVISVMNNSRRVVPADDKLPLSGDRINTSPTGEQEECSRAGPVSSERVSPEIPNESIIDDEPIRYKSNTSDNVTEPCMDNIHTFTLKKYDIEKIGINDKDVSEIHAAAALGQIDLVNELIQKGVSETVMTTGECSPLYYAAQNGFNDVTEVLLKIIGMNNLQVGNSDGNTPLHAATYYNHLDVVKTLLNHGAAVNAKNAKGLSPIFYAVQNGSVDILKVLLKCKHLTSDDSSVPEAGATLLHYAAQNGHEKIVALLVGNHIVNCNVQTIGLGMTPLHLAVLNHREKVVDILLKVNSINIDLGDINLETPLHYAAKMGNVELARTLLKKGAPVDAESVSGDTPLSYAISNRNEEVEQILNATLQLLSTRNTDTIEDILNRGAVINAKDADCATVLHHAAVNDETDIVEFILNRMKVINPSALLTFVNAKAFMGEVTALMLASEKNRLRIVELMINCGADPNIRDRSKETALHYAAKAGNAEIAQILLNGAVINAKNRDGLTVLHHAASNGSTETAECILKGMKETNPSELQTFVNTKTFDDEVTALMIAVKKNALKVAQLLMDYGADPNIPNRSKQTSLHYAANRGNVEIAKALLNAGASVDARSAFGDTPLSNAKSCKNQNVEDILDKTIRLMRKRPLTSYEILKSGGAINATIENGFSLLHLAIEEGDTGIVECILKCMKQTNPSTFLRLLNAKNNNGITALMIAVSKNSSDIAKLLLDFGADPNIHNKLTPLHLAVEWADDDLIELLLSKGACYNAMDLLNQTPLDTAKERNATKIVAILELTERLFVAKTADELDRILKSSGSCIINARNKHGYTILHQACESGQDQIVEYVLEYAKTTNFNISVLSDKSPTPMALAVWNGFPKIVRLLLFYEADDPNISDPFKMAIEQGKKREIFGILLQTYNMPLRSETFSSFVFERLKKAPESQTIH